MLCTLNCFAFYWQNRNKICVVHTTHLFKKEFTNWFQLFYGNTLLLCKYLVNGIIWSCPCRIFLEKIPCRDLLILVPFCHQKKKTEYDFWDPTEEILFGNLRDSGAHFYFLKFSSTTTLCVYLRRVIFLVSLTTSIVIPVLYYRYQNLDMHIYVFREKHAEFPAWVSFC